MNFLLKDVGEHTKTIFVHDSFTPMGHKFIDVPREKWDRTTVYKKVCKCGTVIMYRDSDDSIFGMLLNRKYNDIGDLHCIYSEEDHLVWDIID